MLNDDETPFNVLNYDIDRAASLDSLYSDPATRWYAEKMMMVDAIVAAGKWDPLLHPRGRDGKFIETFGFVRWLVKSGHGNHWSWAKGQVQSIEDNGNIKVKLVSGDSLPLGSTLLYSPEQARKKLYVAAETKATLSLPSSLSDKESDGWVKIKGQGGSNPGGFFKPPTAEHQEMPTPGDTDPTYYVKKAKSKNHAANEVLANRLYEEAGVPVAETTLGDDGITLASQLVPFGESKATIGDSYSSGDEEALHDFRSDFVVDAWLANWDVVGLGMENTQVVDGIPYRIDTGGALLYRAQGAPKGSAFGPKVGELDSLLDSSLNSKSAKVFKGINQAELLEGAHKVAAVEPERIKALVAASGLDPSLSDTLIARRQYILDKFDIAGPETLPEELKPKTDTSVKAEIPESESASKSPVVALPDSGSPIPVANINDISSLVYSSANGGWGQKNPDEDWDEQKAAYLQATKLDFPVEKVGLPNIQPGDWIKYRGMMALVTSFELGAPNVFIPYAGKTVNAASSTSTWEKYPFGESNLGAYYAQLQQKVLDVEVSNFALNPASMKFKFGLDGEKTVPGLLVHDDVMFQLGDNDTIRVSYSDGSVNTRNVAIFSVETGKTYSIEVHNDELILVEPNASGGTTPVSFDVMYNTEVGDPPIYEIESLVSLGGTHQTPFTDNVAKAIITRPKPESGSINPEDVFLPTAGEVADADEALKAKAELSEIADGGLTPVNSEAELPTLFFQEDFVEAINKFKKTYTPNGENDPFLKLVDLVPDLMASYGDSPQESGGGYTQSEFAQNLDGIFGSMFKSQKLAIYNAILSTHPEPELDLEPELDQEPEPESTAISGLQNINVQLSGGHGVYFTPGSPGSDVDAQSLVGKVVLFTSDNPDTGSPRLFTVTDYSPDSGELVGYPVIPAGDETMSKMTLTFVHNPLVEAKFTDVSSFYTLENAKNFADPIFESDGSITLDGLYVGEYTETADQVSYTLYPSSTLSGVSISGMVDSKDKAKDFAKQKLLPVVTDWSLNPATPEDSAASSTIPTIHEGLSPKLYVHNAVDFSVLSDEDKDSAAENLVGKVVAIKREPHHGKVVTSIAFVAAYDKKLKALKLTTAGGHTTVKSVKTTFGVKKTTLYDLTGQYTPDDIATSPKIVIKANGDITQGGVVIGKASKTVYGGFKAIISPEFSVTDKEMHFASSKKYILRKQIDSSILLKPKSKKGKAKKESKVHEEVAAFVSKDIPGAPKFEDGTEAKLGDWFKFTKGGGGFTGKIVGWPDPEHYPGLVIAVDPDGTSKIVSLDTKKKVSGPTGEIPETIPNAYSGLLYGDGKIPVVGQKVKAGKGNSEITGIVTGINTKNGWAYILDENGVQKSKSFSTVTVLEEPNLFWDPAIPAIAKVEVASLASKEAKGLSPTSTEPQNSGFVQAQAIKDAWLKNPSHKLTEDGYAPEVGMLVKQQSWKSAAVITGFNPGGTVTVTRSNLETFEVEVSDLSVVSLSNSYLPGLPVTSGGVASLNIPSYDSLSSPLTSDATYYLVQRKDPVSSDILTSVILEITSGANPSMHIYNNGAKFPVPFDGGWVLKPENSFYKLGTADPSKVSGSKITAHANVNSVGSVGGFEYVNILTEDGMYQYDITVTPPVLIGDKPVATAPNSGSAPEPTPIEAGIPKAVTEAAESSLADLKVDVDTSSDSFDLASLPTTGSLDSPKLVATSSIMPLVPPTPPTKTKDMEADTPIPELTGELPDYAALPKSLQGSGVNTLQAGLDRMLKMKDSTETGSGSFYALGDGSVVDDMQFRFNVESISGQEYATMRVRLREDMSETQMAKFLRTSGGMVGAWKLKGMAFPADLVIGDRIAVYVGGNNQKSGEKMLKPLDSEGPNAQVIGLPVLIGKSPGVNDSLFVTYRVPVQFEDGSTGEVDMQMRPGLSVKTFEWDVNAPAAQTGTQLVLSQTAKAAGWVDTGPMRTSITSGAVETNAKGVFENSHGFQGSTTNIVNGSGGRRLHRETADGSHIIFNSAHETEGGIGNDTTRRANISGEVKILVPLNGQNSAEIMQSFGESLELVGLEGALQKAPSDEDLVKYALTKLVSTYNPTFVYRSAQVSGPDDPRVAETLAYMSKELKPYLGRDVELSDLRLHTHSSGRLQPMLHPDVGKAIAKRQKITYFRHSIYGGYTTLKALATSPHTGLKSTDERWSLGIGTKGLSSQKDMTIGSGDRVYMSGMSGNSVSENSVALNPTIIGSSLEQYNNQYNNNDNFGRRGDQNFFMTTGHGRETMYKREIDLDFLGIIVVDSVDTRDSYIAKLKAKGITAIGGRPIEDVIQTSTGASKLVGSDNWLDTGIEVLADDIPITNLIGGAGAGVSVTPPSAGVAASAVGDIDFPKPSFEGEPQGSSARDEEATDV